MDVLELVAEARRWPKVNPLAEACPACGAAPFQPCTEPTPLHSPFGEKQRRDRAPHDTRLSARINHLPGLLADALEGGNAKTP